MGWFTTSNYKCRGWTVFGGRGEPHYNMPLYPEETGDVLWSSFCIQWYVIGQDMWITQLEDNYI